MPEPLCFQCKKIIVGKPWITYKSNPNIHVCGYHCNYVSDLLKTMYNKIENTEDFVDLRPVQRKKEEIQSFLIKGSFELSLLNSEEYLQYQQDYTNHYIFRPEVAKIHQELQDNQEYESMMEGEFYDSSGELDEDY